MTTPATRNLRLCDVCGQLDDHPRHVQYAVGHAEAVPTGDFMKQVDDLAGENRVPSAAIAELMDPNTLIRHLDCCASRGCPVCQQSESITGGARGTKLVSLLTSGAVDHLGGGAGEPDQTDEEA